jgi:DNA polymerase III subunit alpha
MSYFPLVCHTHYSLLKGLSKPKDLVKRVKELGLEGCAMTDFSTLAGAVVFIKEFTANGLKPILGCKIPIETEFGLSFATVIAKNTEGWKTLVRLSSESNSPENYAKQARLPISRFKEIADKNIIIIEGHIGSSLSKAMFDHDFSSSDAPFDCEEYEESKSYVHPEWVSRCSSLIKDYCESIGKENVFLTVSLQDESNRPCQRVLAEGIRYLSKKTECRPVATNDSRYCAREDSDDHRILLCNLLRTTLPEIKSRMSNVSSSRKNPYKHFFKSSNYHIPSPEEMLGVHTKEEIDNTNLISSMCEEYNILRAPILPEFECPNLETPDEHLRSLCREGWKQKIEQFISEEKQQVYVDRINSELEVLQSSGLSSYFLIVADIINEIRLNRWLPGPGRGSAAGCLVSYLIGITSIDPIKYGLIFERFYNAGRNSEGRVSMPDIDMDVPVSKRDEIIEYIKDKYGEDKVAQMITFQTMMGRSAMKDVLRTHGDVSFEEMNLITQNIPDKADIADDLQHMQESTGKSSIIRWALENRADKLRDWCHIDEDGRLQGKMAKRFEQAIRLEGTKRTQSKHAAGVIISPQPLNEICPMILDSTTKKTVAGMEMQDMEDIGMIKFDVLGVAMLDKIMGIRDILKEGVVNG